MQPKTIRLHKSLIYTKAFHKCRIFKEKINTLKREQSIFKCPNHSKQEQPQLKQIWALYLTVFCSKKPHTSVRQSIRAMETLPGARKVLNTPGQHRATSQQDISAQKSLMGT